MKQSLIAGCVVLAIIASGSTFVAFKSLKSASQSDVLAHRLQGEAAAAKSKLDESASAGAEDQKMIAFLQAETSKLRIESSNATAESFAAQQRADDLQNQLEAEKHARTQYLATIPKPLNIGTPHPFFTKVCGPDGGIIASNAMFNLTVGSRVFFTLDKGTVRGFQGRDLHPLVLQYLGLNLDTLNANQHDFDARTAADRQAWMDQVVALQKQFAIDAEAEAKIALARQQAAQVQADKQTALETERIKANAAMVEAQKPPNQINIIQQQQSQQGH